VQVNPAGRSPQTHYASTDDLPVFGEMDLYANKGVTYRYFNGQVVLPFGFGLSYTSFSYSALQASGGFASTGGSTRCRWMTWKADAAAGLQCPDFGLQHGAIYHHRDQRGAA
jgi:beta-glucosidase